MVRSLRLWVMARTAGALLAVAVSLAACGADNIDPSQEVSVPHSSTLATSEALTSEYVVTKAEFQIQLVLEGVTLGSESIPLVSHSRFIAQLDRPLGTFVEQGEVLGSRVLDPSIEAALESSARSSRIDANLLAQLHSREGELVAPVAGLVVEGDRGSSVAAWGIDAVIELTAIQDLRLQGVELQGSATVETVLGVRSIACVALWVDPADVEVGSPARLHCRLPASTETVPGIPVTVRVQSLLMADVIAVPNVYFGFDPDSDAYTLTYVYDGQELTVEVDVSVTDGASRVVLTEIPEGATILAPRG